MEVRRAPAPRAPRRRPPLQVLRAPIGEPAELGRGGPAQLAAVQRLAGNRAVLSALGVQRACACGGGGGKCECGGDEHEDEGVQRAEDGALAGVGAGVLAGVGGPVSGILGGIVGDAAKGEPKREGVKEGDCPTRCGGVTCPPPFCCPFPLGTATIVKESIRNIFLAGIAIKVRPSVVPVWLQWFEGGSGVQDFTSSFGQDFTDDAATERTSGGLVDRVQAQIDGDKLQSLAAATPPGKEVSLLPALPGGFLAASTAEMEGGSFPVKMNFNFFDTAPGNLAGGIGKTQTACQVGAKPGPMDDARQLKDVVATLVRNPDGSVTVTPRFKFHVEDTVDLCPGDCGGPNEQVATIPMSRLEASGVSGDVPFTVDFFSKTQAPFTTAPPKPPVPHDVTLSAKTLFEFGSSTLKPDAEKKLLAELGDRPSKADLTQPFTVDGFTDSKGSDAVNVPLSQARAQTVVRVLEKNFPNLKGHLVPIGHGSADPVAPNTIGGVDNPAGRAQNRRVELHFSAPAP